MLQNVWDSLLQYSTIEWIGLFTGIIYVILSAQNKIICWVFGIVSCTCIAFHDFFGGAKLYSDGILQLFYVGMGFFGLIQWRKSKVTNDFNLEQRSNVKNHLVIICTAIFISIFYGYLMKSATDAAFPFVDAFTTVFSIAATFLLVYRKLSAWLYFVVIDIVMMYLYYQRGFDLYMVLYLIFTLFAVYGIWNWTRIMKRSASFI